MPLEHADQWARENPGFKSLVDRAIFVRYKTPMAQVTLHMDRMRDDLKDERDFEHITHDMHDYILAVLEGRIIPPKQ